MHFMNLYLIVLKFEPVINFESNCGFKYVTQSKGMSHMPAVFNFDFSI